MPMSLFVAFAQQDADYANALIPALRDAGYLVATDDGTQGAATSGLLNQLVQGDAFVLLLSPATHDDPRAVAASNLAYSLWLQGTIRYFMPVVVTPLPQDNLSGLLYSGDAPSPGWEFFERFVLLYGADAPGDVTERITRSIGNALANDSQERSRAIWKRLRHTGDITGVRDVREVEAATPADKSTDWMAPGSTSPANQPQAPEAPTADDAPPPRPLQDYLQEERDFSERSELADQEEALRGITMPPPSAQGSITLAEPAGETAPPDLVDTRPQEPTTGAPPPPPAGTAAEQAPPASIGSPPPPPPESIAAPMAAPPAEAPGAPPPPAQAPYPTSPPASYPPPPSQPGYGTPQPADGQPAPTAGATASPPAYYPPPAPLPTLQRKKGGIPLPSLPERKRSEGGEQPAPAKEAGPALDVACTAYYPKEIVPQKWESLLVYLALDQPETLAAVAADAAERLVRQADRFRPATAPGQSRLRKGAKLTIVPMLPGFEANPTSITTRWEEDVQRHEFRFRATTATPGQAMNGYVSIFAGGLLFAEIPVSIFVQQAAGRADIPGGFASQMVRAYRKVFASYSHQDGDIVRMCRAAAETTGDRYLMDVTLLRSGQQWNDALLQAISEADLFQLFWSKAAAASEHVANEWRYALQLLPNRPGFIRPVYWSSELFPLPPELAPIHFERLDLVKLGWVRPQPFWKAWFSRV